MQLTDLVFGVDVFNRTGRKNITGTELAALINAASANVGLGAAITGDQDQTFTNQIFTTVDFDAGAVVDYDDLGFWVPGIQTESFIIPAGQNITRVMLWTFSEWATNTTGRRLIRTRKNGGVTGSPAHTAWNTVPPPTGPASSTLQSGVFTAADGDTFGFGASQNSGGNLDLVNRTMGITVIR